MRLDHLLSKRASRVGCVSLFRDEGSSLRDQAAIRPGETPVPMPNTTVKTRPADGTALETVRESRWPPGFIKRHGCTLKTAYTRIFKVMRDLILQCGSACGSIRKNEGTYHAKRGLLGCEADEKTSRRPGKHHNEECANNR